MKFCVKPNKNFNNNFEISFIALKIYLMFNREFNSVVTMVFVITTDLELRDSRFIFDCDGKEVFRNVKIFCQFFDEMKSIRSFWVHIQKRVHFQQRL